MSINHVFLFFEYHLNEFLMVIANLVYILSVLTLQLLECRYRQVLQLCLLKVEGLRRLREGRMLRLYRSCLRSISMNLMNVLSELSRELRYISISISKVRLRSR